jgi:hypothetical protein
MRGDRKSSIRRANDGSGEKRRRIKISLRASPIRRGSTREEKKEDD